MGKFPFHFYIIPFLSRAGEKKAAPPAKKTPLLRRDLHMHPEASMQEFRTTDRICQELDKLNIPYRRLEPTGVIGTIQGGRPGKTVALRADIDALSVEEHTDLPYKSQNPGLMHACGHDTHVAMLLGAARILSGMKDRLPGTVRLIFQPAEETALGTRAVIAQGGLEGVDMIFGLHIAGTSPKGIVAMCPGAAIARIAEHTALVPGAFAMVGGTDLPNHSDKIVFDEDALPHRRGPPLPGGVGFPQRGGRALRLERQENLFSYFPKNMKGPSFWKEGPFKRLWGPVPITLPLGGINTLRTVPPLLEQLLHGPAVAARHRRRPAAQGGAVVDAVPPLQLCQLFHFGQWGALPVEFCHSITFTGHDI